MLKVEHCPKGTATFDQVDCLLSEDKVTIFQTADLKSSNNKANNPIESDHFLLKNSILSQGEDQRGLGRRLRTKEKITEGGSIVLKSENCESKADLKNKGGEVPIPQSRAAQALLLNLISFIAEDEIPLDEVRMLRNAQEGTEMKAKSWTIFFILISLLRPSNFSQDPSEMQKLYLRMRNMVFHLVGKTSTGEGLSRAAKLNKLQIQREPESPFPCNVSNARSAKRPRSVHELRPGDIDVIAAMGDSLTAANGAVASRLIDIATENRGLSWTIGGQGTWRQYLTLPNILKEFNPNLLGYSLGDSLSHHAAAQFNVAEIGSMSRDMDFMARILVKRINADRRINYEKDWKLITLMIGANDFCLEFCYLSPKRFENVAEIHRQQLTSALDYLRDNLPRTLINLVLVPNLEILHDLKGLPDYCSELHLVTCPCLFGKAREAHYPANIAMQREWQKVQREVANDERYSQKEDFAVVLQPFTAHLVFPEVATSKGNVSDKSFLSEDCFHFSQKAYARAANALWNNMLEPLGNKSENWADIFSRFLCPTEEQPFIFTYGNSFT